MILLYKSSSEFEARIIIDMLEAEKIHYHVKNLGLQGLSGEIPFFSITPEIYVSKEQLAQARSIVEDVISSAVTSEELE